MNHITKSILLLLTLALSGATAGRAVSVVTDDDTTVSANEPLPAERKARLKQHIYYLASDSLRGRKAGSEDAAKARTYLQAQYEAMGLQAWKDTMAVEFTWNNNDTPYMNLIGIIPGSDPALKDEYIVLGAHYDHIGIQGDSIVYNGADDNASGSAALVEIARELLSRRSDLKRSVIIAAFDAEELGLYGSTSLAKMMKDEGIDVRLMMSIDMVGWLSKGEALKLEGMGTIRNGDRILSDAASTLGLPIKPVRFEKSILTATDTEGFAKNGVPTLAITTGLKSPYHKPGDDADLIDYDGLDLIVQYLSDITMTFTTDEAFGPSGKLSFKHQKKADTSFALGVSAGLGSARFDFPKSAFTGKTSFSWDAGLSARLYMKHLGIIADAYYGQYSALYPDRDNLFGAYRTFRETAVTVPVNIVYQTPRSHRIGAYIGAGAWYSHVFSANAADLDAAMSARDNDWGWCWTFGIDMYNLTLSDTFLASVSNPLLGPPAPSPCHLKAVLCNLTWYF